MFNECDEFGYGIYGYGKPRRIARITFPEHPEAPIDQIGAVSYAH